jgi:hypothetical protein
MRFSLQRLCLLLIITSLSYSLWAAEKVTFGDWMVQTSPGSIEASTSVGETSFGLYCQTDQCMFYLHDSLRCQPGAKSPTLMSGTGSAASVNIQCTQINGVLFQILEPFNVVLEEVKRGGFVSFAVPLQNGTFGVSRFSLNGGFDAVKKALQEAGKNRPAPQVIKPPPQIIQIIPPTLLVPSVPPARQSQPMQPTPPVQPTQPVPGSKRLQDIMI